MILHNARILTMDETLPVASAVAIAGGRILGGVDSREDVIASQAHERVDLQGATVVPGLVDAHVHFRSWAASRARLDLRHVDSYESLLDAVRTHAAGLDDGAWVLGGGWREEAMGGASDAGDDLRIAAGGRPAALVSKDGHALWTTAEATAQLGLSVDELDAMAGGVVERTARGTFAGVLRETSAWAVRRVLPDTDITTRVLAAAMREASRRGVTAVHDMDGAGGFRAWRALEQERGLTLRVWQYFLDRELPHLRELGMSAGFGSSHLRVAGIKAFADGTLGSGTAWLHEPEGGSAPRQQVVINDAATLQAIAAQSAAAGLPLAVHAIGDAAVSAVVDALQATHDAWKGLAAPPRIEHVQLARPTDIERAARLGIALSVQPSHLVNDRDEAERRWGERCSRAYAYRTMLDAGALLAFGSDAPIEDLSPLAAMHAAVERCGGAHGLSPAPSDTWYPQQSVDAGSALAASTAWAADAVGAGAELGRVTPGRMADLVVLSGDPTAEPVSGIEVVATMVAGRWTYGAANLTSR